MTLIFLHPCIRQAWGNQPPTNEEIDSGGANDGDSDHGDHERQFQQSTVGTVGKHNSFVLGHRSFLKPNSFFLTDVGKYFERLLRQLC